MSQPTVCVVMLVNGRAEMTRRAIASFRAQTYERKRLLIWNTGPHGPAIEDAEALDHGSQIHEPCLIGPWEGRTIGYLRNAAISSLLEDGPPPPDLIAHFDSDDWSHSRRLEEQVALLEASGRACVGYREMLFWDTRCQQPEAWLYRNPGRGLCAGGTIMYRRELWEQCPFPDAPHEDIRWWSENQAASAGYLDASAMDGIEPRFIAHIHGGNTETIGRKGMLSGGGVWWRAQQFDAYCQERMKL